MDALHQEIWWGNIDRQHPRAPALAVLLETMKGKVLMYY